MLLLPGVVIERGAKIDRLVQCLQVVREDEVGSRFRVYGVWRVENFSDACDCLLVLLEFDYGMTSCNFECGGEFFLCLDQFLVYISHDEF